MRKAGFLYTILLTVSGWVNGQVFIGTEPTGNPVALEVKSTNAGVLIPRISIPDLSLPGPVSNPKTGLLAINVFAASGAGLVFWNGKKWEQIETYEVAKAHLANSGKIANLAAKTVSAIEIQSGKYAFISIEGFFGNGGSSTYGKRGKVSANGIYEITANFTATITSSIDACYAIRLDKVSTQNSDTILLSQNVGYQTRAFSKITGKTTYCGELETTDEVGINVFYYSNVSSVRIYVQSAFLSIKRLD
ncbi:MAG: hypothetical protein LBQ39_11140 [Tannerellaceae bacterium]|jgi:hypothetical protein|nr:hypothetical protein [Tannerellaceae bacterium]